MPPIEGDGPGDSPGCSPHDPPAGRRTCRSLASLLAAGILAQSGGPALAATQYQLLPHVGVAEVYDDNLFGAPSGGTTVVTGPAPDPSTPPPTRFVDREDDLITRITPGLSAGIDTGYFTLRGGYSFRAAYHADHSELDSVRQGQNGGIGSSWQVSERLSASLFGSYRQSESARDLNAGHNPLVVDPDLQLATGVETRRGRARTWSIGPSATYQLGPLTNVSADYHYSGGSRVGGSRTDHHSAAAGVHRQLTPLDTVDLRYTVTGFDFSGNRDPNSPIGRDPGGSLSHSVTAGWARLLDPLTRLTARVGPRVTEGELRSADAHASLLRSFEHGAVSIGYSRNLGSILGTAGTFEGDRAWIGGGYAPWTDFATWGRFSYFRNSGGGFDSNVYLASLGVSYPLTSWLYLQSAYQFRYQDQRFFGVGSGADEVYRNVVTLQISTAYAIGSDALLGPFAGIDPALSDALGALGGQPGTPLRPSIRP